MINYTVASAALGLITAGSFAWHTPTTAEPPTQPTSPQSVQFAEDNTPTAYVIRKDLAQLSAEADRIVVGTVRSIEAAWHPRRRIIVTHAEIQVDQTLKGDRAPFATVSTFGGTIGDMTMHAGSSRHLHEGQRVAVFLKWIPELEMWMAAGASQGKFDVELDGATEFVRPTAPYICEGYVSPTKRGVAGQLAAQSFYDVVERLVATEGGKR